MTPIQATCKNCNRLLSAQQVPNARVERWGYKDLRFVHTNSGSERCEIVNIAKPLNGFQALEAYNEATRKRHVQD